VSWLGGGRRKAVASLPRLESPGGNTEGLEDTANQTGEGCQERNPSNRKFGKH